MLFRSRISFTHADYRELAESLKNTDLIFRIHRLLELQGQACRDVASSLRADMPYAYSARLAKPKPAVQSGGIKAVAIATPGIGLPLSSRVSEITPTNPPTKAISTS